MIPLFTEKAPKPVGPYSQALVAGGFLFLSGQIGIDPKTGKLREEFVEQVKQVFENIDAILQSAGIGRDRIVRVVVYLKDISLFREFNSLYEDFFKDVPVKPVRTTVEVSALPLGALVELEITALMKEETKI